MKLIIDIDEKTKNLVDSRKSLPLSSIIELEKAISCGIPLDYLRAEITAIAINGQVDEHTLFRRTGEQVKQMALEIINKYRKGVNE